MKKSLLFNHLGEGKPLKKSKVTVLNISNDSDATEENGWSNNTKSPVYVTVKVISTAALETEKKKNGGVWDGIHIA